MLIARFRDIQGIHLGVVEDGAVRPIDTSPLVTPDDERHLGVAALSAVGWRERDPLRLGPPPVRSTPSSCRPRCRIPRRSSASASTIVSTPR